MVYNFPPSISAGSVARPAQLYLAQAEEDGILRDARLLEGPQFVGVDGISDLPDSAILAHLHGFIEGRLRAAEFHPDAWQPAIVRDPATTRARLLAVAGDKYSYQELEQYTDELKRTFQTVPQVTKVDRLGVLDEQVTLSFSQERLASYGITLGRLRDVLQARNTALGGGQMEVGDRTVTLEPSGEFRDAREIGGVIVGSSSAGVPLYLRDLVNVDREYQNPPRYLNQYSWADSAGQWHRGRAVTLALQMRPGEKIGDFGHAVDSALDRGAPPAAARPHPGPHLRPAAAGGGEHPPADEQPVGGGHPGRAGGARGVLGVALGGAAGAQHPAHAGAHVRHDGGARRRPAAGLDRLAHHRAGPAGGRAGGGG